jgi:ubiquinone/menaquinone biosynthesis C-methylase UbiE
MRIRRFAFILLAALIAAGAAGQQQSVKPGINEQWKSPDVKPLVERLESESREIYTHRRELAALVAPKPGMTVADIGAGSGFMVEEFARLVGPQGRVYAVDINPQMMAYVAERAKSLGLGNVKTIVGTDVSPELPPNSVDLIFICDTYHHFEFPEKMLAAIRAALKPGGELVLVEIRRSAGWAREHVRADQDEFIREITAGGFALAAVQDAPFLQENYVVRFRKEAGYR